MTQLKYRLSTIPVRVSRKDFNRYILPHLGKGKRGPKPKISYYKIFNYVLHVLHTGIQWDQLQTYRNEIYWTNIYKWHNRWSKDGTYANLFLDSVIQLRRGNRLDLSIVHGDGSNTVAKKGEKESGTRGINIRKVLRS